jgi:hypothetical protein
MIYEYELYLYIVYAYTHESVCLHTPISLYSRILCKLCHYTYNYMKHEQFNNDYTEHIAEWYPNEESIAIDVEW